MDRIKRRLQKIQISLYEEDFEMAVLEATLLPESPKLFDIITALNSQNYPQATELIEAYIKQTSTSVVVFEDKEIQALCIQLQELESAIETLTEQKVKRVFLVNEFTTKQNLAGGDTIRQILLLRKEIEKEKLRKKREKYARTRSALEQEEANLKKLKIKQQKLKALLDALNDLDLSDDEIQEKLNALDDEITELEQEIKSKRDKIKKEYLDSECTSEHAYQEAKQEYEQFDEAYQEAKDDKVAKLSKEDAGLLKRLFRKAIKLCHPDLVADEFNNQAHDITQQLNNACDNADIQKVQLLLNQLETGITFKITIDSIKERAQIEKKIEQLLDKLEELKIEIEAINESETWRLIVSIDSWEEYFDEQKNELTVYLAELKSERKMLFNTATTAP